MSGKWTSACGTQVPRRSARSARRGGCRAAALALSLAAAFTLSTDAAAASKIATLNHTSGEFAVGYPHQRKVVRDASGYWYVAYMDYNGTTSKYEIYLTKSTNTAGTGWATPVKIAGASGILYNEATYDFRYPAIDIDRTNGRLHLAFDRVVSIGTSTNGLVYSKCTNLTSWNQASSWYQINGTTQGYNTVRSDAYVGSTPMHAHSLSLDASGEVHLGYASGSYNHLYYLYGTAASG